MYQWPTWKMPEAFVQNGIKSQDFVIFSHDIYMSIYIYLYMCVLKILNLHSADQSVYPLLGDCFSMTSIPKRKYKW